MVRSRSYSVWTRGLGSVATVGGHHDKTSSEQASRQVQKVWRKVHGADRSSHRIEGGGHGNGGIPSFHPLQRQHGGLDGLPQPSARLRVATMVARCRGSPSSFQQGLTGDTSTENSPPTKSASHEVVLFCLFNYFSFHHNSSEDAAAPLSCSLRRRIRAIQ